MINDKLLRRHFDKDVIGDGRMTSNTNFLSIAGPDNAKWEFESYGTIDTFVGHFMAIILCLLWNRIFAASASSEEGYQREIREGQRRANHGLDWRLASVMTLVYPLNE